MQITCKSGNVDFSKRNIANPSLHVLPHLNITHFEFSLASLFCQSQKNSRQLQKVPHKVIALDVCKFFKRMVMPEEVEKKSVVPELPQESADKQPDEGKVDAIVAESIYSNVELKQNIVQVEDEEIKCRLVDELKFRTSSQHVSTLREYVQRMLEGQKYIYYMVGRSPQLLTRSPFVLRFLNAGVEVVYMTDPILDDLVVNKIDRCYSGFRLVSVKSEVVELPRLPYQKFDRNKRKREALDEFLPLLKRMKSVNSHQIHKIVISNTLVKDSCAMVPSHEVAEEEDEPSFIVNPEWGNMRLEINPDSNALRLLCIQARLLERKQDQFDGVLKLFFNPPLSEDSIIIQQPCSPISNDSELSDEF